MRSHYLAMALAISAVTLAACSSGGSSSPPATTPATTQASTPATSSGSAVSQVTANWESFFSGTTSAATKMSVLQNGQTYASVIDAQAGSAISKSTTAKVLSVSVNSAGTQAAVKYTIYFGTSPALANQTGVAFDENGTWVVGDSTFCALLALENNGKAPSVCSSAG
jgi:hypothetical protein